jgi:hypothetical protein
MGGTELCARASEERENVRATDRIMKPTPYHDLAACPIGDGLTEVASEKAA